MIHLFSKRLTALVAVFTAFSFASAQPLQEKDWTILVFLNGNNNLDSYGKEDVNEMEKVGSTDRVNVVVQWASYGTRKTKRLKVIKDSNVSTVTSPILQDMGQVDMGSVEELVNFVKWGKENFPAKKYFVDVWNHGNGWQKSLTGLPAFKDVSYDDFSGNRITTEQLGEAMARSKEIIGHNVSIFGFDACLMAMAEIAAEIAESTDFMVASEDLEPGDGWPYDDFLAAVEALPDAEITPAQMSQALVQTYGTSYSGGSQGNDSVTLSAFDLNAFKEMYPAYKELAVAINGVANSADAKLIKDAISNTLGFYGSDYKDLGSFLAQLQAKNLGGISANLIANVQAQLSKVVIANNPTGNFSEAKGLSLWIPSYTSSWSYYGTRYQGFKFDTETQWSSWIETMALLNLE